MSYSEAATRLKEYCGTDDLLNAMRRVQGQIEEGVRQGADVREAYYTLMAGMSRLVG